MSYVFNVMPLFGGNNIMRISALFIVLSYALSAGAAAFAADSLQINFARSVYDAVEETSLKHPEGVGCTDDYFVVADTGNNRLVKYTFSDGIATPVDPEMPVNSPIMVQINSKGQIYALDGDRRIVMINADGSDQGYLAPKGSPVARKMIPRSFKIDQNDTIHILDISEGVVLILDSEGNYLRHIPVPEEAGFFSDLAVDRQGNVFLVDSTEVALYAAAKGEDRFTALASELSDYANFPTNIAADSGTIFLVDKHGGSLVLLNQDGSFLGHRFGYGWKNAQFYYPGQLCINPEGDLFIADRGNSRVQIFTSEQ